MNPSRHTFVSDAVPHAGLGLSATRRIVGGQPGIADAWQLTQAEKDAVRLEALPAVADPAAGIVGVGACNNPVTKQPCCLFWAECSRAMIAGEARACQAQEARADNRAAEDAQRAAAAALSERMLAVMRAAAAPLLFAEILTALDITDAVDYDMARGALLWLHHHGRIVAMGQRLRKSGRSYKPAKLWAIREED